MHLGGVPLIIHFPRPWGLWCSTCSKNYYHLHSAHLRMGAQLVEVTQSGSSSQRVFIKDREGVLYILLIKQVYQSNISFFAVVLPLKEERRL